MPSFLFRCGKRGRKPHNPLCSLLEEAIKEEESTGDDYLKIAKEAEKENQHEASRLLRDISEDEEDHKRTLKALYEDLECKK